MENMGSLGIIDLLFPGLASRGNTLRYYFKDTATPHFLNVAMRCIVLIKTAFSQATPLPSLVIVVA